jgi:hypothetical protein
MTRKAAGAAAESIMQSQYVWLGILVVGLAALAFVFAWRQVQTLFWLRTQPQMPREDVQYFTRRSYARLVGCVLLFVLAGLLAGLYAFGILEGLDALVADGADARAAGRHLTEEQEDFVSFAYGYVGAIALVLFALMIGGFIDTMATRRYGMRHRKRIRDDRQAMLARQLPLLRRERNGQD